LHRWINDTREKVKQDVHLFNVCIHGDTISLVFDYSIAERQMVMMIVVGECQEEGIDDERVGDGECETTHDQSSSAGAGWLQLVLTFR
jgi:hypothetical protein